MSRAGHHGDVSYVFEDNGFDSSPTDTNFKVFGGNATLDTFEGSHEAVRIYNADRRAAQIIEQVFDGAWSVSHEISETPWYLSTIFGDPTTTGTGPFTHLYDLDNGNDPNTLRLYMPTDGFNEYKYIGGCAVASVQLDSSQPGNPEMTLTGAYASPPQTASSLTPTPPSFTEDSTFSNRDGDVRLDGSSVGRVQNTTITLQANTELIGEIGSGTMVDFVPRAFNPEWSFDKILWTSQTLDPLDRFSSTNQVVGGLELDNGLTGTDEFSVDVNVNDSFPNQWSETGRNDPEADLIEELQEMGEDATVEIVNNTASPPV